jgi:hypothetical protein
MVIKAFNREFNDADSSIKGSNPGARKLITRGRVAGVNRRRGTRIVAGFCLPRDHGVRFPDRAAFVPGIRWRFAQGFFGFRVVALCVCVLASFGIHGI